MSDRDLEYRVTWNAPHQYLRDTEGNLKIRVFRREFKTWNAASGQALKLKSDPRNKNVLVEVRAVDPWQELE